MDTLSKPASLKINIDIKNAKNVLNLQNNTNVQLVSLNYKSKYYAEQSPREPATVKNANMRKFSMETKHNSSFDTTYLILPKLNTTKLSQINSFKESVNLFKPFHQLKHSDKEGLLRDSYQTSKTSTTKKSARRSIVYNRKILQPITLN